MQKIYIIKICNNFASTIVISQLPAMPIKVLELMLTPKNKAIIDFSWTLYQQKISLLFYAAIAIRLDIVFAIFKLLRFN